MERVLEPEIMDDPEQALAYARANFEAENQGFVDRFVEIHPDITAGHVLDLGCGPADIPIRLAQTLPRCRITGVDASLSMIHLGKEAVHAARLADRIALHCERIQSYSTNDKADAVISNSLLHHLVNPFKFWHGLKQLARPGASVLVMDLLRPESREQAQSLVDQYAAHEAAILRRDFFNSLLAAFTEDEVAAQLAELNLSRLLIDVVDDRHWIVSGRLY
ncbi:MAG TPA: class I SAM-dependent methyltransferase [Nitrospiraceae bacterium]|nr:class I SAM-dependent methyltransferase [Nitrospiraceae bacterium]